MSISQSKNNNQNGEDSFLGTIASIASTPHAKNGVILRLYLQSLARELMPHERVSDCLRAIIPICQTVDVIYDPKNQRAHYKNLITCGSVWMCPVCASRITEQRAQELQQAVQKWQESGFVALLTFTLRHEAKDELGAVLGQIREAHRTFKAGRNWYQFTERFGWAGSVTALEVTHGANGWHPHLHELVFFDPMHTATWTVFRNTAKERWLKALAASNADATWKHGLDLKTADSQIAEYVTKFGHLPVAKSWTLEREIAKSASKRSRSKDGRSPFQLLMDYGDGDTSAGKLFQEYARTFKGRNQLTWSRGLREELLPDQPMSDEQLVEQLPDEYILLVSLTRHDWKIILALPDEVRGRILEIASHFDVRLLAAYLSQFGITLVS
jgi:hypothetical protein